MMTRMGKTGNGSGNGYVTCLLATFALSLAVRADAFEAVLLWMAIVCCVSTINKL